MNSANDVFESSNLAVIDFFLIRLIFNFFLFIFSSATKEAIPAEERLSQLLERLESLEYRLNTESRQKTELADEVAQLREENQRLQEESATAAQQLRRFTEWFFQTIEKA